MFYIDASAVVAALAHEPAADRVWDWLEGLEAGSLHASPWVGTEVSSALAIKVRMGTLSVLQRQEILLTYATFAVSSLVMIDIENAQFEAAARFIDHIETGLRAGDALHLAIAKAHGLTFATLDKQLAKAGPSFGVATLLL